MVNFGWRTTALGLTAAAALTIAGCDGPPSEETTPPPAPMANAEPTAPPPAPDLAGGPPEAPPPPVEAPVETATMAPIPNPEDMSPDQRAAIYGHRYDAPAEVAYRPRFHHHRIHRAYYLAAAAGGLRHAHARLAPSSVAARLKPAVPAPAPQPPAATAKLGDRLLQLQAKLQGPAGQLAVFKVADDVAAGKPGAVTLTLPANLLDQLRSEAAKLDLTQSASRVDFSAILAGDGYDITPAAEQTQHVKTGAPQTFTWQVAPRAGAATGALRASAAAELIGAGATHTVPLLSLEQAVKTPDASASGATDAAGATADNSGGVKLPGVGQVPMGYLAAIAILVLAGLAMVAAYRQSADRERERRRKARAAAAARFDQEVEAARASAPPAAAPVTVVQPPPARPVEVRPPERV